jgi:hypothetical protein
MSDSNAVIFSYTDPFCRWVPIGRERPAPVDAELRDMASNPRLDTTPLTGHTPSGYQLVERIPENT